jgi:hypothetical protein
MQAALATGQAQGVLRQRLIIAMENVYLAPIIGSRTRCLQVQSGENRDPWKIIAMRLPTNTNSTSNFVIPKQRRSKTLVTLDQSIVFQHDSSMAIATSEWCQMDKRAPRIDDKDVPWAGFPRQSQLPPAS